MMKKKRRRSASSKYCSTVLATVPLLRYTLKHAKHKALRPRALDRLDRSFGCWTESWMQ